MRVKGFRKDINGLRAWAVISVVLFHFSIQGAAGGFVGVDIFFVISGFLMMQILLRTVESDELASRQILKFYTARAIRIVPALVALVTSILCIGWFALPVADYRMLGKHAASSLAFVSNITYWTEANYFDASSHDKWLLHTWSLSVEWQFYLLLPLALAVAWKINPRRSFIEQCSWVGFIASLLLAIVLTPLKPTGAFFLLPTRAWEMFAGGITFFYASRLTLSESSRKLGANLGIFLIASSIVLCNETLAWPSYWALIPVGGAALVILSAREHSLWTGSQFAQWVGDRSYSIYLWHWPIAVTLSYFGRGNQPSFIALGLAMTLVFAHLSYKYIETPSRQFLISWETTRTAALTTTVAILVMVPALMIVYTNGLKGRLSATVEHVFEAAYDRNPRWEECHVEGPQPIPGCKYGGEELGAIVIGDSHAAAVIRSVEKALPSKRLHVLDWTMSGCPTIEGIKMKPGQASPNCSDVVSDLITRAAQLPNNVPVFIVNRSSNYLFPQRRGIPDIAGPLVYLHQPTTTPTRQLVEEYQAGLIETACKFAKTHPVYMLRPVPEMHQRVPNTLARGMLIGEQRHVSISMREYEERHRAVWTAQDNAAKTCQINIIDPTPILCPKGECVGSLGGMPLYYDDNHLSEYGATLLVPLFRSAFDEMRVH